jgi:predicted signal transduction protein with EAL and GGDEF domain
LRGRTACSTSASAYGLVEVGKDSGSAESVLGAADSACYIAKQQGRGRTHVYSTRDEVMARERGEIQWLQRLQRALKENGFELYVQPIVAMGGRNRSGPAAEVLLRMRDESGRLDPARALPRVRGALSTDVAHRSLGRANDADGDCRRRAASAGRAHLQHQSCRRKRSATTTSSSSSSTCSTTRASAPTESASKCASQLS